MKLLEELASYSCWDEQECADRKVICDYIRLFDNVYTRDNAFGHITSSPWIINEDASKVLMIYHNIYDSWGWCGGHADGDKDLSYVALKEGKEETGVTLELLSKDIFAIDVLPVPRHVKNGRFITSHVHLNMTYLCRAKETDELVCKPDENSGVRWVNIADIDSLVREKEMLPVYHKLMEKTKRFMKQEYGRQKA